MGTIRPFQLAFQPECGHVCGREAAGHCVSDADPGSTHLPAVLSLQRDTTVRLGVMGHFWHLSSSRLSSHSMEQSLPEFKGMAGNRIVSEETVLFFFLKMCFILLMGLFTSFPKRFKRLGQAKARCLSGSPRSVARAQALRPSSSAFPGFTSRKLTLKWSIWNQTGTHEIAHMRLAHMRCQSPRQHPNLLCHNVSPRLFYF